MNDGAQPTALSGPGAGQADPRPAGEKQVCREVLDRAFEYIDGELGPLDCDKIRRHLLECAPCLREYDASEHLKALVRRSCACDAAPLELRAKILLRITEVRATYGG
ncbi:mycothiol system anti-sigma-R factor [Kineococcus xinjiangensis]|uniref:Mycothiol system anti-sigma-R factor n=1 Tax=Kineococcus xinjiangensis TaxID=512762 RepID=A0A2S6IWR0_9ACTN|nr:mycothiol system anti-sigma-R factor [Kineococcus xinjiangensis]PPK98716.1 mycothiol system anti-sigma-R factor [Kineococcus xinjiangensis]